MPTPASSATAYASASDLINAYDARVIGDLVKDDDSRASSAELSGDAKVDSALLWASGRVEAACLTGERYTPDDLAALEGASLAYLKGLVCDLAHWRLRKRREPGATVDEVAGARDAFDDLEQLALGRLIFGLVEVQEAGQPEAADLDEDNDDDIAERPTTLARRFFGRRGRGNI